MSLKRPIAYRCPRPDGLLRAAEPTLRRLRPQLAKHFRNSQLAEVAKAVDEALLMGVLNRDPADVAVLLEARNMMAARREARAGKPK